MSPDNVNTFRMASASSARNEEQLALSIVIPVYHSADCLEALNAAISEALGPLGIPYEVILVNDCSPDESWTVIEHLCRSHANVVGVDLRTEFRAGQRHPDRHSTSSRTIYRSYGRRSAARP